ncbi:serine/threonine-protein kinase N1-like [Xenopus laevis]|uniref:Serine/threonine-protein kinase N1-like n=1 Tax=Xenopus laevis TaxID=8355 RepID=A0A8J1LAP3_XENLA|nr:serine/threonine-protein kinase N1-like [Xenopus laevis]
MSRNLMAHSCFCLIFSLKLEKAILEEAKREKNPFLVGLYASFQSRDHFCLAMDYCPGGDLKTYLNVSSFPKETAVFYSGCIVLGLQFLHERNIIHRDIKPPNILLDSDGYARIADFGMAKKTAGYDGTATTDCGTLPYMAPEIFRSRFYTKSVDWWALGILIYKMLLNKSCHLSGLDLDKAFPVKSGSSLIDMVRSQLLITT